MAHDPDQDHDTMPTTTTLATTTTTTMAATADDGTPRARPTLASVSHDMRELYNAWRNHEERLHVVEQHADDHEAHPTKFAAVEGRLTELHTALMTAITAGTTREDAALDGIATKLKSLEMWQLTSREDAAHRQTRLRQISEDQQKAKLAAEQAVRMADQARQDIIGVIKTYARHAITLLLTLLVPLLLGALQPAKGTGSTPNKPLELVVVGLVLFGAMQLVPLIGRYIRAGNAARRASHAARATFTLPPNGTDAVAPLTDEGNAP